MAIFEVRIKLQSSVRFLVNIDRSRGQIFLVMLRDVEFIVHCIFKYFSERFKSSNTSLFLTTIVLDIDMQVSEINASCQNLTCAFYRHKSAEIYEQKHIA